MPRTSGAQYGVNTVIVKITTTGGAIREAKAESISYHDDVKVLCAWFWCYEKGGIEKLYIRVIHIAEIEYIK